MSVRSLDVDGDWEFGKGRNDYKSGAKFVAQSLQTRIKSSLGNCFFDVDAGIDWFNLLGSKNKKAISLAVSSIILNTEDVIAIVALSVNLSQNRNINLSYEIETVYGRSSGIIEQSVG